MNREDYNNIVIEEAVNALKDDGVIILPTDTVYGLAVSYNSEAGVKKIYDIKKRKLDKKLPIIVNSYEMLERYCDVDLSVIKRLHAFFPGKLTVVLKKKDSDNTIAVRMINNEIINRIIESLDCPLYLTSANESGEKPLNDIVDIVDKFEGVVDMIVVGNKLSNVPSTIVSIDGDNLTLIREGSLCFNDIVDTYKRGL